MKTLTILFFGSIAGVILVFRVKRTKLVREHKSRIDDLNDRLHLVKRAQSHRQYRIDRYDFKLYNLEDIYKTNKGV